MGERMDASEYVRYLQAGRGHTKTAQAQPQTNAPAKPSWLGGKVLDKVRQRPFDARKHQELGRVLESYGIPKDPETFQRFEQILQQEKARVPSTLDRVKGWVGRNRGKLGLGAAGLGALYVGSRVLRSRPDQPPEDGYGQEGMGV